MMTERASGPVLKPVLYNAATPAPKITRSPNLSKVAARFEINAPYFGALMAESLDDAADITGLTIHVDARTIRHGVKHVYTRGTYDHKTKTATLFAGSLVQHYKWIAHHYRQVYTCPDSRRMHLSLLATESLLHEIRHHLDMTLVGEAALEAEKRAHRLEVWQALYPGTTADLPTNDEIYNDAVLYKALYKQSPGEIRADQYAEEQEYRMRKTARHSGEWPIKAETYDMYVPRFANTAWAITRAAEWVVDKCDP